MIENSAILRRVESNFVTKEVVYGIFPLFYLSNLSSLYSQINEIKLINDEISSPFLHVSKT